TPYAPFARSLAARFGIAATDSDAERRDKITAAVTSAVQAQRVTEVAPLVAHVLRLPFDDSPVVGPLLDSPQRLEARLFMALKRWLAAECERHPVLLVVETREECETDTITSLQSLAAGMREHRLAILATATPALYEHHA